MPSTLYICYFGLREPLVQTQVLPYLREIGKASVATSLLTFEPDLKEKWSQTEVEEMRIWLAKEGVEWHHLRYHKRPSVPATLFDIANGARFIRNLANAKKFDILHCRSHVPMMMAAVAKKGIRRKPKLLFDIRGFMPEEYVDAGIWPRGGSIYRGAKRAESWLMKEADGFVLLTEKGKEVISDSIGPRPVEVIPCCVDLERFEVANEDSRGEYRNRLGIGDRFAVAYVGALGGWYLTEETAKFFGELRSQNARAFAIILTQSDPEMIVQLLKDVGFEEGDMFVGKVSSAEIPRYLSAADAAVSFIKPCFSKLASSPTKNAEYLAAGLPIVINDGIGDSTWMTREDEVGVVIDDLTPQRLAEAAGEITRLALSERETVNQRCRASARRRFDLETVGGTRYRRLYETLINSRLW